MKRQLVATLAALAFASPAFAQSEPWQRLEKNGAIYAGTIDQYAQSIEIYCPATGNATLEVRSPRFRVSVPDGHRYSLTFITDQGRFEIMATAKETTLNYEASDLNARVTLENLVAALSNSKQISVSMSPFGWQKTFTGEGAAEALRGLLDHC